MSRAVDPKPSSTAVLREAGESAVTDYRGLKRKGKQRHRRKQMREHRLGAHKRKPMRRASRG